MEWKKLSGSGSSIILSEHRSKTGRLVHALVRVTPVLPQELAVEEVDEDLPYPCFREAVRSVHGDELAAYALQLRQGHRRRR